ncbi:MAG: phosphatidate cytidylyltransferase [Candidatus Omnitrophota bacterium]
MESSILKRVITMVSIFSAATIITLMLPNWVFCLLVISLIGPALFEFFQIVERKGLVAYKYFGVVTGIVLPIAIYLHLGEGFADVEPFFIVIACLFAFILQLTRVEPTKDHLITIALTLFALFYISWFLSFFIKIKYLPHGSMLVFFVLMVTKSGDVGAYFIGRKFGKNALISRISPKKTKEGAIGGLVCSLIAAVLCGRFLLNFPFHHVLVLGVLLGIIGQIGDLAESLFKRDFDVKDSSKSLPGVGGVLDVIDSLLFTAPIFYFYVKIFFIS